MSKTDPIGRRRFLELGLFAATAVWVGPIDPAPPEKRVADPYPCADDDWAVMESVIDALGPSGEAYPKAASMGLKPLFENLMGQMEAVDRGRFFSLLSLIQYSTVPSHFSRFTKLPREARQEALMSWGESRFVLRRQAFAALKMTTCVVYFAADASWKPIGYDGPWMEQTEIEVLDPPPLSFYRDEETKP
jgi:hypothetical protein